MKRNIRSAEQLEELVDLYAKTDEGWKLVFHNITEDQAQDILDAGRATGQNRFSIVNEESRRVRELNRKALGISSSSSIRASRYYADADTYIVQISHPGGEEVYKIVADSPDEAKERAARYWKGRIDSIVIIDVNP